MDQATLVSPDLEGGRKLVAALDDAGLDIRAAFWLYREESESWRLYLATPLVKTQGLKVAYTKVLEEFDSLEIPNLKFWNISVIDPELPLVVRLKTAVHTEPKIDLITFIGNTIDGVHIPPAYIYRINA